jgi:hypothetical protein
MYSSNVTTGIQLIERAKAFSLGEGQSQFSFIGTEMKLSFEKKNLARANNLSYILLSSCQDII